MTKLFLLKPNFTDFKIDQGTQHYYCPHCAVIEGILKYYPQLKGFIDINYVDFERPRKEIIDLIGEKNQGCPVLIIDKSQSKDIDTSYFKPFDDKLFVNTTVLIAQYLAEKFKIGLPHP